MKKLSLAFMLAVVSISTMLAQRTITGTVTDPKGETLIGVSIFARGTSTGTVSDVDGTYSLRVPEGVTTLVFSYTGFRTEEVALGASNVIDLSMNEATEQLAEVVVTGLGIRKEKKALGYGVTTIKSGDINLKAESDVARILRGKATGVDITQTSGLAGSGTNVIIRGFSSITGDNQPLFVVDGVPFNSDTNSDRNGTSGGATASSRFLDLDPNNISEISILKGLSATVLYGEAGRNGVILVTTKTGNVGEDTKAKGFEISLSQSVHNTKVANIPDYQDSYGNGFSGNYGAFFSNWGPAFSTRGSNGIDANGQIKHLYDQTQYNDDFPEYIGVRYDYKPYSSVEDFWQTGLVSNTSVGIDKNFGNGNAVSANYSYLYDEGVTPRDGDDNATNYLRKNNLGLGASTRLANGLGLRATFNYVASERRVPPASVGFGSNPAGASLFANLLYTPRSVDLLGLPYQSPLDGSQAYYRTGSAIQNPLWTLDNAYDTEDVRRFFGTISLDYKLTDWLMATYRLGIDQYTQTQHRSVNKGGGQVADGQYATSERLNRITDQVFNLLFDHNLNEDWNIDGILGVNVRSIENEFAAALSSNQFVFDLFTHNNFINHTAFSATELENNIGVFGTATLGFRNYVYLGVQARNDWTSTLEEANRSVFYPSASLSFIPTEAFAGLHGNNWLNYLKLRVGYGTSAGYPDPYQTRSVLNTQANSFITAGGTVVNTNSVSDRLGNASLKPELHSEFEAGIEGRFLKNRVGLDFSYYNSQSSDLIIDLNLDPATGYTNTTINGAEIENKGIELGINLIPVKTRDFIWDINLNLTRNRNKVLSIAKGIDQIVIGEQIGGVSNAAIPGEPYGVFRGLPYLRHANGGRIVDATGNYIPGNDPVAIGDPNPDFTSNWINTISYKGLSLGFHWQYIKGGDIQSFTAATLLARGNTKDTDFDRSLAVILEGVDEEGNPNTIQGYAGDFFFNSYFFADEGLIFDGTVIRLREVSLSFEIPKSVMSKLPFGSASLRISGENLWYNAPNFPEFVNYDPEVVSTGVGNSRGIENITGPTVKKYGVSLNVTF